MNITGKIFIAHSIRDISETLISELNPSRNILIKSKTTWNKVFPGTLNIRVSGDVLLKIKNLNPFFTEGIVEYPKKYQYIPRKHNGYKYFQGFIENPKYIDILIRIPNNPRRNEIAIIAEEKIIDLLLLKDNDTLNFSIKYKVEVNKKLNIFKDNQNTHVNIENSYKSSSVFLISSGPSFKNFQHKDKLKFVKTIGVNNSLKSLMPYCRPDMFICVDPPHKFLYTVWKDPKTMKIVPMGKHNKPLWNNDTKTALNCNVQDCPNVVYFSLNHDFNCDTYLTEDTVNWGNNGKTKDPNNGVNGKRSVFIACLKVLYALGFKNVFLLGVDFDMQPDKVYSFNETKHAGGCKSNNNTYKQMNFWFNQLQPKFLEADYHVYNCNPDSKLTAFPYISFDEAFKKALYFVQDTNLYISGKLEDVSNLYNSHWHICSNCHKDLMIPEDKFINNGEYKEYACSCGNIIKEPCKKKKKK